MITVDALDPRKRTRARFEVPGSRFELESLPGAAAAQVVLRRGDEVVVSAEVMVSGAETIAVDMREERDGRLLIESGNRQIFFLPREEPAEPALLAADRRESLDVALLVDITAADVEEAERRPALVPLVGGQHWEAVAARVGQLIEALSRSYPQGVRTVVLAFSDVGVSEDGPVQPERAFRLFKPFSAEALAASLKRLRPVNGGDFVDALAEGIAAVVDLPWGQRARKLALLIGNSPGYSVEEAAEPENALLDAHVRQLDVYEQAQILFRHNVGLATVFLPIRTEFLSNAQVKLADVPRRQYDKLAALPEWAMTHPFEVEAESRKLLAAPPLIARGAAPGYFVSAPTG